MASRMDTLGLTLFSQMKADFQSFIRGSTTDAARGPSPAFERLAQLIEANKETELKEALAGLDRYTVMERGENDVTLLHIAAELGNLEIVRQLILAGAKLDVSDRNGWAPLHCAARNGHEEVITALFSAGADCNITTHDRNTALHYFVRSGDPTHTYYVPVLSMLIEHSSGLVNLTNRLGETVLHFAAIGSKNLAAKQLLEAGANPGFANKYGESPLHMAARMNNAELVDLFLEAGASPLKVGRNGTPRQVAEDNNRHAIADRLRQAEYEWKMRRRTAEHETTLDALRRMQDARTTQEMATAELRGGGSKREAPTRPLPTVPNRGRSKTATEKTTVATVARIPTLNSDVTVAQAQAMKSMANLGTVKRADEEEERVCVDTLCEPSTLPTSPATSEAVMPCTDDELSVDDQLKPQRKGSSGRRRSASTRKSSSDGAVSNKGRKPKKRAKKTSSKARQQEEEEEVIAFNPLLVEEEPTLNVTITKEKRVSVMVLHELEKPVEVPKEVEHIVPLHRLPSWEELPQMQSEDSVEYLKFKNALLAEELANARERLFQAEMELTVTHKLLDNTETRLRNAQNENFRYQKKIDLLRKECTCQR